MSFLDNIPEHIETIKRQQNQLARERMRLEHSCDCEYCEYDGVDDENQELYDDLTNQISDCENNIKKLKDYKEFMEKTQKGGKSDEV